MNLKDSNQEGRLPRKRETTSSNANSSSKSEEVKK
jgi:hypothetical protein